MKSRIRRLGSPTLALITPWTAERHDLGRDGAGAVGDQRHLRAAAVDRGDFADQRAALAVAVDHRVADRDAVAAADVDRDVGEPDRRRAGDHPRRHRVVAGGDRAAAVELEQAAQLRFSASADLRPDHFFAQRFQLACAACCFRPCASKVSSNQLTRSRAGFSARSAAYWSGLKIGADPVLDPVRALPVGEGQQREGADDEEGEHRSPAANLLAIHVSGPGLGSSSFVRGGSPRTPRAICPSRSPRRSTATLPVGRASGTRRAAAARSLAAARRRRRA